MYEWRKSPERSSERKRKMTQATALSYQQSSEFSGKPSFSGSTHPQRTILKRVQLDKRRIKLIRLRSESNRALQSRGKPEAERGSVKRMTQIFPRKSEPAFPVFSFDKRDRGSSTRPRNSINRAACSQPAAFARSNRSDSKELGKIDSRNRKKSKQTVRLNSTSRSLLTKRRASISSRRSVLTFSSVNRFFKAKKICMGL